MLQYSIIAGSHRPNSESARVGRYLESRILKKNPNSKVHFISLSGSPVPFWDESAWSGDSKWKTSWKPISDQLKASDAIIVISPEWAGMVPSGLKNLFLLCSQGELSHKPGMIVGVSAGLGGSYPVAELRMSSYKNTQLCYTPEHLVIRKVKEMLLDPEKAENAEDEMLRKRAQYSLDILEQYGLAFKQIRESGVVNLKEFPYGM